MKRQEEEDEHEEHDDEHDVTCKGARLGAVPSLLQGQRHSRHKFKGGEGGATHYIMDQAISFLT